VTFPNNPSDGDTYTLGLRTYTYSSANSFWVLTNDGSGLNLTNLSTNILPSTDATYNIGSATNQWNNVYIANSLNIDGAVITANADGSLNFPAGSAVEADIPETLLDLNIVDGTVGQALLTTGVGTFYFGDVLQYTDLSVTVATAGTAGLTYNNSTGEFTYTPPDLSSYFEFTGDYTELTNRPTIPSGINDLDFIDIVGVTDGQVLKYNSATGNWENENEAGGIDLTDFSVATNSASSSSTLSYNNTTGTFTFTPPDISDFIALTDISVGADGAASGSGSLTYNSTSGVFTYTPPDLSDFVTSTSFNLALDDLTDVAASSPSNNHVLRYDSNAQQWESSPENTGVNLTDLSASVNPSPSGSGNFQYNSASGVFTFTKPDLSPYATSSSLSTVATTGSYNDLSNTPTIPSALTDLGITDGTSGQILSTDGSGNFTFVDSGVDLTAFSVGAEGTASGNGSVEYNNTTGVFTYTPPVIPADLSDLTDNNGLLEPPYIVSVSPTTFGGDNASTFTVRGGHFKSNGSISFKDQNGDYWTAGTYTFTSSSEVEVTTPKAFTVADGPLGVRYTDTGGTNPVELTNLIGTGGAPSWVTASGSLATLTVGDPTNVTVQANEPDGQTIIYSVTVGQLPPNVTLGTFTGVISGSGPASLGAPTTYAFTIQAQDTAGNSTPQNFSITYNP
jgi:hypothetical protein